MTFSIALTTAVGPERAAALDSRGKQEIGLPSPRHLLRFHRNAAGVRDRYLEDRDSLMVTLGAWATGSIASGLALWTGAHDDERRAIGVQFVAWGSVNLALAWIALIRTPLQRAAGQRAEARRDSPLSVPEVVTSDYWRDERSSLRSIFSWNAALDVLYVTAGILLRALGETDWVRGTGTGIIVQGGFLVLFDSASAIFSGARDLP